MTIAGLNTCTCYTRNGVLYQCNHCHYKRASEAASTLSSEFGVVLQELDCGRIIKLDSDTGKHRKGTIVFLANAFTPCDFMDIDDVCHALRDFAYRFRVHGKGRPAKTLAKG